MLTPETVERLGKELFSSLNSVLAKENLERHDGLGLITAMISTFLSVNNLSQHELDVIVAHLQRNVPIRPQQGDYNVLTSKSIH